MADFMASSIYNFGNKQSQFMAKRTIDNKNDSYNTPIPLAGASFGFNKVETKSPNSDGIFTCKNQFAYDNSKSLNGLLFGKPEEPVDNAEVPKTDEVKPEEPVDNAEVPKTDEVKPEEPVDNIDEPKTEPEKKLDEKTRSALMAEYEELKAKMDTYKDQLQSPNNGALVSGDAIMMSSVRGKLRELEEKLDIQAPYNDNFTIGLKWTSSQAYSRI